MKEDYGAKLALLLRRRRVVNGQLFLKFSIHVFNSHSFADATHQL